MLTENIITKVDWDKLLKEVEEKCGRDIANAIRARFEASEKRLKVLEYGEDEWQWWT